MPLIDAARHGRAADVVVLLAGGADVNETTTDGVTPLYIQSGNKSTSLSEYKIASYTSCAASLTRLHLSRKRA